MADEQSIGKLIVRLLLEDTQYKKALETSAKATEQANKKIQDETKKTKEALDRTAVAHERIAKVGTWAGEKLVQGFKYATAAIAGLAAAVVYLGVNFEYQMSKVAAVRGIPRMSEEFEILTAKARKLGETTLYTATQVAEGMEQLARAGLQTKEILEVTDDALKLAAASGTDMVLSSAMIASTMRTYGYDATQATRITDVFSHTIANSLFNLDELGTALRYAGPIAAAFGLSLEETSAAIAQFRDLGLEASQAGTTYRMAMAAAAAPTDEARRALEKYGLTIEDINPATKSFKEILTSVGSVGMSVADSIEIFGLRAGGAMSRLGTQMAADSTKYDTMLAGLQEAAGTTAEMYDTMTTNVRGRMWELQSAVEEVFLKLFEPVREPMIALLEAFRDLAKKTGSYLGAMTTDLDRGFGESIRLLADYIRQHMDEWALRIATTIREIGRVAKVITTVVVPALGVLLPLLDEIAILLATIWLTAKGMAFAHFIVSVLIPAVSGATLSFSGMGAALAAATGGISVLVTGLAILAAGLALVAKRAWDAKEAQDALTASAEAATYKEETYERTALSAMTTLLEATQKSMRAKAELMKDPTGLSEEQIAAFEKEKIAIEELTAATAKAAWETGKLVSVEGELQTTEYALTQSGAGREAVLRRIERLNRDIGSDEQDLSEARQSNDLEEVVRLEKRIEMERTAAETLQTAYDGVTRTATDAEITLAELLAEMDANSVHQAETVEVTEDRIKELLGTIRDETAQLGMDEAQQFEWILAKKREAIQAAYDEQVAEEKATGERLAELEAERLAALQAVDIYAARVRTVAAGEAQRAELEQQAEETLAFNEATEQELRSRIADLRAKAEEKSLTELEKLEREFAEVQLVIASASAEDRAIIEKDYLERLARLRAEQSRESKDFFEKLLDGAQWAFGGMVDAIHAVSAAFQTMLGFGSSVLGFFEKLTGFSFSLSEGIQAVIDAQNEANQAGVRAGGTSRSTRVSNGQVAQNYVSGLVTEATTFFSTFVAMAPVFIRELVKQIPVLIQAVAAELPGLIQSVVDELPALIDAIVAEIPTILQAVVDGLVIIVEALPGLVQKILEALPGIITALLEQLPVLITAILEALPIIVEEIFKALPDIITALIDGLLEALPVIFVGLAEAIPQVLTAIYEGIPGIIRAIISKIPDIITTLIGMIPDVMVAFAEQLPTLIPAFIAMWPEIVFAIVAGLPEIAIAFLKAIIIELPKAMIEIIPILIKALGEAIIEAFKSVGAAIADFFKGIFGKGKDKEGGEAFSGIAYVPATMRMTLHQGEAVLPANRNPYRSQGRTDPALAGARSAIATGSSKIAIDVLLGRRVVDAVLVETNARGEATGLTRMINRSAGVKIGFDRGNYNPWSK